MLFAVAHGANPVGIDAERHQVVLDRIRPLLAERQIVFARAAFVGMPGDRDRNDGKPLEPFRLPLEHVSRLRRKIESVEFEEHPIADLALEVLYTCLAPV